MKKFKGKAFNHIVHIVVSKMTPIKQKSLSINNHAFISIKTPEKKLENQNKKIFKELKTQKTSMNIKHITSFSTHNSNLKEKSQNEIIKNTNQISSILNKNSIDKTKGEKFFSVNKDKDNKENKSYMTNYTAYKNETKYIYGKNFYTEVKKNESLPQTSTSTMIKQEKIKTNDNNNYKSKKEKNQKKVHNYKNLRYLYRSKFIDHYSNNKDNNKNEKKSSIIIKEIKKGFDQEGNRNQGKINNNQGFNTMNSYVIKNIERNKVNNNHVFNSGGKNQENGYAFIVHKRESKNIQSPNKGKEITPLNLNDKIYSNIKNNNLTDSTNKKENDKNGNKYDINKEILKNIYNKSNKINKSNSEFYSKLEMNNFIRNANNNNDKNELNNNKSYNINKKNNFISPYDNSKKKNIDINSNKGKSLGSNIIDNIRKSLLPEASSDSDSENDSDNSNDYENYHSENKSPFYRFNRNNFKTKDSYVDTYKNNYNINFNQKNHNNINLKDSHIKKNPLHKNNKNYYERGNSKNYNVYNQNKSLTKSFSQEDFSTRPSALQSSVPATNNTKKDLLTDKYNGYIKKDIPKPESKNKIQIQLIKKVSIENNEDDNDFNQKMYNKIAKNRPYSTSKIVDESKNISNKTKNKIFRKDDSFKILRDQTYNAKPIKKEMKCPICKKDIPDFAFKYHFMKHPSKIFDWLFLGSFENALNHKELDTLGIKNILNCTVECIDHNVPDKINYLQLKILDEEDFDIFSFFEEANDFIYKVKRRGEKILVHCKFGISRSSSVIISYMVKKMGFTVDGAFEFIQGKRKMANPNKGFMNQLYEYQSYLGY